MKRLMFLALLLVASLPLRVFAAADKPNILVIWGDDIGYWNLSHINHGMLGYQTPDDNPEQ
jgi:arylsulfatase